MLLRQKKTQAEFLSYSKLFGQKLTDSYRIKTYIIGLRKKI